MRARDLHVEPRRTDELRCPYCHGALAARDRFATCRGCSAVHHASCLAEHGACASCDTVARRRRLEPTDRAVPETDRFAWILMGLFGGGVFVAVAAFLFVAALRNGDPGTAVLTTAGLGLALAFLVSGTAHEWRSAR